MFAGERFCRLQRFAGWCLVEPPCALLHLLFPFCHFLKRNLLALLTARVPRLRGSSSYLLAISLLLFFASLGVTLIRHNSQTQVRRNPNSRCPQASVPRSRSQTGVDIVRFLLAALFTAGSCSTYPATHFAITLLLHSMSAPIENHFAKRPSRTNWVPGSPTEICGKDFLRPGLTVIPGNEIRQQAVAARGLSKVDHRESDFETTVGSGAHHGRGLRKGTR
jgi:hypothetical protein